MHAYQCIHTGGYVHLHAVYDKNIVTEYNGNVKQWTISVRHTCDISKRNRRNHKK